MMLVTERTREQSARARVAHDAQTQPRRSYSYERAGELWIPKTKRLEFLGGGPCGSFAARSGPGDDLWQPTSVPGFALDLNPSFDYTLDVITTITVSSILNHAPGTGDAFINVSKSLQPLYEAAGWVCSTVRPSLLFDGLNDYLACSTGLAASFVGGNDTPWWAFSVGQNLDVTVSDRVIFGFFSSSDNLPLWDLFAHPATSQYQSLKRDDTGTQAAPLGGTPNTAKHILGVAHSGTQVDVDIGGASILSASQNVGTLTVNRMAIGGSYANSAPGNHSNYRLARFLAGTGAISVPNASYIRGTLTNLYF